MTETKTNRTLINISKKTFVQVTILLAALLVFAIVLTYLVPKGEFGIKVSEVGPFEYSAAEKGPGKWEWCFIPALTKACNMCEDRVAKGKFPMCVQHCQAWCMYYGEVEDLVKKIDGKTRWALLTTAEQA